MNFSKVKTGHLCWIYLGDRLWLLPNVDRTTLLHRGNLYWVPSDEQVVRPAPHHPAPRSSQARPISSSQPPPPDYSDFQDTLRSIQEEQVFLREFVASESTALRDFVQERHGELRGLLASQTQYFQDHRACLEAWWDQHISSVQPPHPPLPPPPWSCLMLLPSPFLLCAHIEGNVWFKHGGVVIIFGIWCLFLFGVLLLCICFFVSVFIVFDCFSFVLEVHLIFF